MHPWREIGQMVVVPNSHRLAGRTQLEPSDLAGGPHREATPAVLHRR
ncbi:MAG: hypothetical protein ACOCV2_14055 [Persicimonas sp.]